MNEKLKKYVRLHIPGYVVSVYDDGIEREVVFGNRVVRPEMKNCNSDTLYDIASLTKVYTAVLIYMAYEEGKLDILSEVKAVDDRFSQLEKVRIVDLLCHNQEVWTEGFLGDAKSREEFDRILCSARVKSEKPTYIDAHYMILASMLERLHDQPFAELLRERIFEPLDLKQTTVEPTGDNIASTDYERRGMEVIEGIEPGVLHDTKARRAKELGITAGHAAIFTTSRELLGFLKALMNGKLLKRKTLDLMLQFEEGNDYNFMGTRHKRTKQMAEGILNLCSERSIEFSGYTGPMFVMDLEKRIIIVVMCNSVHNTKMGRRERKRLTEELGMEILQCL